jgi:hypothetical protein
MAQISPHGVVRDGQLAGDLRRRQVHRQIAQHPDLAIAQRLQQRLRPTGARGELASRKQAQDVSDQGRVSTKVTMRSAGPVIGSIVGVWVLGPMVKTYHGSRPRCQAVCSRFVR